MRCPNCKAVVYRDEHECHDCGHRLGDATAPRRNPICKIDGCGQYATVGLYCEECYHKHRKQVTSVEAKLRAEMDRHPEWKKQPGEDSESYGLRMLAVMKRLAKGVIQPMPQPTPRDYDRRFAETVPPKDTTAVPDNYAYRQREPGSDDDIGEVA